MRSLHMKVATAASMALLALPLCTSALTAEELQQQIKSLMTQLTSLQQQMKELCATSTSTACVAHGPTGGPMLGVASSTDAHPPRSMCPDIAHAIKQGTSGEDVKQLQQWMADQDNSDDFGDDSVTGFFGPRSMKAMAHLQETFGIASSTDGSVGPKTMEFFRRGCMRPDHTDNSIWAREMMGSSTRPFPGEMNGDIKEMMDKARAMMGSTTPPQITPEMKKKMEDMMGSSTLPIPPDMRDKVRNEIKKMSPDDMNDLMKKAFDFLKKDN